jgi:hypothetical protein
MLQYRHADTRESAMTAAATTEPARPKLALNKKRVVNVAALKQQNPTPAPTPVQQPAEPVLTRKERHALKMKEQAEAAERKRAKHAEFLAQQTRHRAEERARNRVANEEAKKRATAHRKAFNSMFSKLTMIGCNKPLAINSYAILLEYAHTKIGKEVAGVTVRRALQQHCDVGKYLNMLAASAGKPRYNPLNGEIMGEVTAEEAAHAKAVMDERRAKRKAAKGDSVLAQPVQTGMESA